MALTTTVGKMLLTDMFPEDMREDVLTTELNENGLDKVMTILYKNHPEKYTDVLYKLNELGANVSSTYGSQSSMDLESISTTEEMREVNLRLKEDLKDVARSSLDPMDKKEAYAGILNVAREKLEQLSSDHVEGRAFGIQRKSGTRDKLGDITNILAGETYASGMDGEPLPYAITSGYGAGLSPLEYTLASQKARSGLIGVKLSTPEAGDISNQLAEATLRLRITEDKEPRDVVIGIMADVEDPDFEGSIVSQDIEGIVQKGDELTPSVINRLRDQEIDRVLVYSPVISQAQHGVTRESAGHAFGHDLDIGDFAGQIAASSLTEKFVQKNIGSKHVGQKGTSGLDAFRQLISVPKKFATKAAISKKSGQVTDIKKLDSGAHNIYVGGEEHYLEPGLEPEVSVGDRVRAGDMMSEGLPSSRELVDILGIGGGRMKFAEILSKRFRDSGIEHNKRLTEFLATGLINHARVKEHYEDLIPGDIVEFSQIEREYKVPDDTTDEKLSQTHGKYLQRPAGYHTIGTKVNDEVIRNLKELGIDKVSVSSQEPFWEPEVRPARGALQYSRDPLMRFYGSSVKRNVLDSLYSGTGETDLDDPTSFVGQMLLEGAPRSLQPDEEQELRRLPSMAIDQMFVQ